MFDVVPHFGVSATVGTFVPPVVSLVEAFTSFAGGFLPARRYRARATEACASMAFGFYTGPHREPASRFCSPVSEASCPVVGNVFGFTCRDCRYVTIGAFVVSLGTSAEFRFECAVYTAWNSVS